VEALKTKSQKLKRHRGSYVFEEVMINMEILSGEF